MSNPSRLIEEFNRVGTDHYMGEALSPAKDKWMELGPLRLEDIIANSDSPVNTNLPFG